MLIVEDNADAAEGLMMLIEAYGHEVQVAPDGVAAMDLAESFVPDLMLVDLGLPGMDGYELARRVRLEPRFAEIPLIALTGYGKDEDRERTRAAGFAHHLVKPVDPAELRVMLKEYAAKRTAS